VLRTWLLAMAALAIMTGDALAQTTPLNAGSPPAAAGATIMQTPRGGPGLVTGSVGSASTIMIPGSAVGGSVMNNGNGTSTLTVPGRIPETIPTPR
jgi:hypothetical protein